jgi:hypothetical protein
VTAASRDLHPVWMADEVAARIPNRDLHLHEGAGHAFH